MASILSKVFITDTVATGRLSDRSDRISTNLSYWLVVVLDDFGVKRQLYFTADPTDQQVLDVLPAGSRLSPTRKSDYEAGYLIALFEAWQRWKTTRIEAEARALAAAIITALQTKENAAWSAYATALNNWRTAS